MPLPPSLTRAGKLGQTRIHRHHGECAPGLSTPEAALPRLRSHLLKPHARPTVIDTLQLPPTTPQLFALPRPAAASRAHGAPILGLVPTSSARVMQAHAHAV